MISTSIIININIRLANITLCNFILYFLVFYFYSLFFLYFSKYKMERLEDLYGIGPVLARKIATEGIEGMYINLSKPIRPQLKKVMQYLPLMTQADLIFHPTRRILRRHIAEIEHVLDVMLVAKHDIAGSYRRGKSVSTDIDLIIKHKPFTPESAAALVEKINGSKNKVFKIVNVFSQGTDKMGVIVRKGVEHYKMDIFAATQNYPFMLLFGTGSGQF